MPLTPSNTFENSAVAIPSKGSELTDAILQGYKDVENRSIQLPDTAGKEIATRAQTLTTRLGTETEGKRRIKNKNYLHAIWDQERRTANGKQFCEFRPPTHHENHTDA